MPAMAPPGDLYLQHIPHNLPCPDQRGYWVGHASASDTSPFSIPLVAGARAETGASRGTTHSCASPHCTTRMDCRHIARIRAPALPRSSRNRGTSDFVAQPPRDREPHLSRRVPEIRDGSTGRWTAFSARARRRPCEKHEEREGRRFPPLWWLVSTGPDTGRSPVVETTTDTFHGRSPWTEEQQLSLRLSSGRGPPARRVG
jgi:hypothetical protein